MKPAAGGRTSSPTSLISYYRYTLWRNGGNEVWRGKVVRMSKSPSIRHQQVAEDILAKAALLFDELGYGLTSLQDIADAVGIARPSLYHYFRSKEELLSTLVERTTRSREEIADEVARMDASPQERLSTLLRRLGNATAVNPIGLRLQVNPDIGAAAGREALQAQHARPGGDHRVGQRNGQPDGVCRCEKARTHHQVHRAEQLGRQVRLMQAAFKEVRVCHRPWRRGGQPQLPGASKVQQ